MLTVARSYPECVRALVLNSPLPTNAFYEQDALLNINEALEQVFDDCAADSVDQDVYASLRERFHDYFSQISGKIFSLRYKPKGSSDSITVQYTKNELLDAVVNRLTSDQVSTVPAVIDDLIRGHHKKYVCEVLDGYFTGDSSLAAGMRYSVYCSEQIAYCDAATIDRQNRLLQWLSGYRFNDVDAALCNCWKVKPEPPLVKTSIYSNIPVLISGGDVDPWCRPFYNRLIEHSMPNSQLLLIHNRGHGAGFTVDGTDYLKLFLEHPYQKLFSRSKDVVVE